MVRWVFVNVMDLNVLSPFLTDTASVIMSKENLG